MKRDERDMLIEIHTIVKEMKDDVEDHEKRIRHGETIDTILTFISTVFIAIGSWIFTRGGN